VAKQGTIVKKIAYVILFHVWYAASGVRRRKSLVVVAGWRYDGVNGCCGERQGGGVGSAVRENGGVRRRSNRRRLKYVGSC